MLGIGKPKQPKQIEEREARGEIAFTYHQIRQVLRVSGVSLNFRIWATHGRFLPAMWEAMQPNAETQVFEEAADLLRAEAVRAADSLGALRDVARFPLGPSQAYHVRGALDLYHYINPKLLLLTAAVHLALAGERVGRGVPGPVPRIARGVPPRMHPMEMAAEDNPEAREVFADIARTQGLRALHSDYRTLALWPQYLRAVWQHLKPAVLQPAYEQAATALREQARRLARDLPYQVPLTQEQLGGLGADAEAVSATTAEFFQSLPTLILNIAHCQLVWLPAEVLMRSPFPAAPFSGEGGVA